MFKNWGKYYKLKQPFIETKFYRVYISPLINLLFAVLGNTVGIWALYIFVNVFFLRVWRNLKWPGIEIFINDGSILLISFSFLASALYYTTRRGKITFKNVFSLILLLFNTGFFWRAIAIKQSNDLSIQNDFLIYKVSMIMFFASIVWLYVILARDKYVENTDLEEERNNEYDQLTQTFNSNQNG